MFKIQLIEYKKETENLYKIVVQIPEEIYIKYKIPGQYGIFSINKNDKLFFAFANAPENPECILELLIKKTEYTSTFLNTVLHSNEKIYILDIQGKGLPVENTQRKSIELFAMGTGIAPIRAWLQYYFQNNISLKMIELWFSCFTPQDMPFKEDFEYWKNQFPVHTIYDKIYPFKNVVQILEELERDYKNKVVYWIGSKQYGEDLWQVLEKKGLKKENYLTNYE